MLNLLKTCATLALGLLKCDLPDCEEPATQLDVATAPHESVITPTTPQLEVGKEVVVKCQDQSENEQ